MSLLELFCRVDDFWLSFAPAWHQILLQAGTIKRQQSLQLVESEIMTILIQFHQSHFRDFKAFYTEQVLKLSFVRYKRRFSKPYLFIPAHCNRSQSGSK